MNSSNVQRNGENWADENSNTPAIDPVVEAAASVGAAPVSAPTPQAHPGDMSGTFNPDPPFWDMIGRRGEREVWRDRTL